jgi:hypothetical protein
MGQLQALLQFLAKASGIVSGRLSDVLSPARMVVLGTLLTALCKPMFGLVGAVHAMLGSTACVTWIASAKVSTGQQDFLPGLVCKGAFRAERAGYCFGSASLGDCLPVEKALLLA